MSGLLVGVSAVVATVSLFLTAASLLVAITGGVVFAPFLFGLFLLALLGVFSGVENRNVRQHNPSMNPASWRDGASAVDADGARDRDVDLAGQRHDRERRSTHDRARPRGEPGRPPVGYRHGVRPIASGSSTTRRRTA